VLGSPLVKRGRADAGLPAQRRHWLPGLGPLDQTNDLAVLELQCLHWNLLGIHYEKIPLLTSAKIRGITAGSVVANAVYAAATLNGTHHDWRVVWASVAGFSVLALATLLLNFKSLRTQEA
jgi:hypothetical protein